MTVTFVAGLLQLVILVLAGKYLLSIDWGSSITECSDRPGLCVFHHVPGTAALGNC